MSVELICASENHPTQVKRVKEAASEFASRLSLAMANTKIAAGDMKKSIAPAAGQAGLAIKRVATDVWSYVYRK